MTIKHRLYIMLDKMNHFRSADSTRPDSTCAPVIQRAVARNVKTIARWAVATDNASDAFAGDPAFSNLIFLSCVEEPDAYAAARYLEDIACWDVSVELVFLLDTIFQDIPTCAEEMVREWVLETGTRFNADPGSHVIVRIDDEEYLAYVHAVKAATAQAKVSLHSQDEARSIWVNAEDVVEAST